MEERAPETLTFRAADGTTYEIPVRTAAEAERLFRIARCVAARFADDGCDCEADGYAPEAEPAADAAAAADVAASHVACGGIAPGDIDLAIDIMVAEGVPRENVAREPWITFAPKSLGWRDALGMSPSRLCVKGVDSYVLQGPAGTLVLDEAAACPVPDCILMHPTVAFHCPLRHCTRPHVLDLDGPWHSTRDGAPAVVRRAKAYQAAGMPAIAISTAEYPLGTWAGALQRIMHKHLRGARRAARPRR